MRKLNRNLAALERSSQSLTRHDGPALVKKLADQLLEKLSQPPFELHMHLSDANWIHLKLADSTSPDVHSNPSTPRRPSLQLPLSGPSHHTSASASLTAKYRHPLDAFFEYPLTDFVEASWKVGDHHVPVLLHALFEELEPQSSTSSPLPSPSSTLSRSQAQTRQHLLPTYLVGKLPISLEQRDQLEQLVQHDDICVRQLWSHIDGVKHVARIAHDAAMDAPLVRACISNLAHFGLVRFVSKFQFSNQYMATHRLLQLVQSASSGSDPTRLSAFERFALAFCCMRSPLEQKGGAHVSEASGSGSRHSSGRTPSDDRKTARFTDSSETTVVATPTTAAATAVPPVQQAASIATKKANPKSRDESAGAEITFEELLDVFVRFSPPRLARSSVQDVRESLEPRVRRAINMPHVVQLGELFGLLRRVHCYPLHPDSVSREPLNTLSLTQPQTPTQTQGTSSATQTAQSTPTHQSYAAAQQSAAANAALSATLTACYQFADLCDGRCCTDELCVRDDCSFDLLVQKLRADPHAIHFIYK